MREIQSGVPSGRGPRFRIARIQTGRPPKSDRARDGEYGYEVAVAQTGSASSSNYTDLAVNSLVAAASGVGDGGTLAVSEACARWWSSALTSASVAPDVPALAGLTPSTLALIGRELFHRGESLFTINVIGGQVQLLPVSSFPRGRLSRPVQLEICLPAFRPFPNPFANAGSSSGGAFSLCAQHHAAVAR